MTTVYCIFRNDTDGHSYSFETMIGILGSYVEAEAMLSKRCEAAKKYFDFKKESAVKTCETWTKIRGLRKTQDELILNKRKGVKDLAAKILNLYEENNKITQELEEFTYALMEEYPQVDIWEVSQGTDSITIDDYEIRPINVGEMIA